MSQTSSEPNYASNNKSEHHITYAATPLHHSYLPARTISHKTAINSLVPSHDKLLL